MFKEYLGEAKFSEIASSLSQDCVYCTSYLTAAYLKEELRDDMDATINIIGTDDLREEIVSAGFRNAKLQFTYIDGAYDTCLYEKEFTAFTPDPTVRAIVTGYSDTANFRELAIAGVYLGQENVKFVTTNDDPVYINDERSMRKKLDVGALLGPLETCSGRTAVRVGKPNPSGFRQMLKDHFGDQQSLWESEKFL